MTPCMNTCNYVRIRRRNLPSSVRAQAPAESTTSSECVVARLSMKKTLPKPVMKLGKGQSMDSSQGSPRTARNKPHSAPANQVFGTQEHRMLPVQHTLTLSLQPKKQPLLARLDAIVEAAFAAFLGALDDSENRTAQLYLQKATDEAWQQTVQGHSGPTITNPTIPDVE